MGNTRNAYMAVARQIFCFKIGAGIGLEEIWSDGEANSPIKVTVIALFEGTNFKCH